LVVSAIVKRFVFLMITSVVTFFGHLKHFRVKR